MKNVASLKSHSKNESPKTPGGISKSLLTPCRRVGLSRNWKKKGPAPFISPLASITSNTIEPVGLKKDTRKRKSTVEPDEKPNDKVDTETEVGDTSNTEEIVKTPLRNIELPRRKKSKTFLSTLNSPGCKKSLQSAISNDFDDCTKENATVEEGKEQDIDVETPTTETIDQVKISPPSEPSKTTQKKFQSPLKSFSKSSNPVSVEETILVTPKNVAKPKKQKSETKPTKTRSPNELTKECIVVIQRKLLKVKEKYSKCNTEVIENVKKNSQPLFDSEDEAPLSSINKKENSKVMTTISLDDDDDEFVETSCKNKSRKTESTNKKKDDSKKTSKPDSKAQKPIIIHPSTDFKTASQNSFDDDDDDFFDKKKTILIRKTYDKVVKPHKAKSTGSITQRDIDDLKARIEVKKKMLLARSMTSETEELRSLIKKWQKGCQEALVELMDLMKIKCPDKHNMDYSEILQMLKIPAAMVGYDSDHDCFVTPDDSSAVLSKYNDY